MNTLADELKEQEYLGYWWLPVEDGQQEDNRAGVLHFKPDGRANLNLLGAFERDVQFLTNWMRMFLTAMVLEYCGMPDSSIYTAFSKNHEYQELAAKIPLLMHNS